MGPYCIRIILTYCYAGRSFPFLGILFNLGREPELAETYGDMPTSILISYCAETTYHLIEVMIPYNILNVIFIFCIINTTFKSHRIADCSQIPNFRAQHC